jgi:sugar/nucleoside kinase (ribokinase family)
MTARGRAKASGGRGTVDLAVVGTPFLDFTFEGLEGLPRPGEEMLSRDLHISPGGPAMTAIAAARLGLRVVLVSPVGRDLPGRYLHGLLRAESVEWMGPSVDRSAVTVVMPFAEDRAMATFNPKIEPSSDDVARVDARAVVLQLWQLNLRPPRARVYAVTEFPEVEEGIELPNDLADLDAVIANEHEAQVLTGESDPEAAAFKLTAWTDVAVVTRGPAGAIGVSGEEVHHVPGLRVTARDTTGAGDVFVSAYVWADLAGLPLRDRLRWATIYAGLSVRTYTPLAGTVPLSELLRVGREQGLSAPEFDPKGRARTRNR